MGARFYIGPAGWSYPDWEGIVYPPAVSRARRHLEWISQWFNLVEINSTFYRLPRPSTAAAWAETVSRWDGFRFSVKLPQAFTHQRLLEPAEVRAGREILSVLADAGRLGCALAQFPWSCRCDRLEKVHLRRLLDAFEPFPLAVEVRHPSWDTEAYYGYLRQRGVAACNIDQPPVGGHLPLGARVTARRAYLRLHGRNREAWLRPEAGRDERYNYLYTDTELEEFARLARAMAGEADEVYIVTNNHYRGKAVFNALQLGRLLTPGEPAAEGRPPGWPAMLEAAVRRGGGPPVPG